MFTSHKVAVFPHWVAGLTLGPFCLVPLCVCASMLLPVISYFLFFSPSNPIDLPPAHQLHLHWAAIRQRHWHSQASVCSEAWCVFGPCALHRDYIIYCCAVSLTRRVAEKGRLREGSQPEEAPVRFNRSTFYAQITHRRIRLSHVVVYWKNPLRTNTVCLFIF